MRSGDVRGRLPGRERGVGYLMALFALAAIGLLLAGTGEVWQTSARRSKEAELLFIGAQFRQAIASYHRAGPADARVYPPTLDELLEDRRFAVPRRHLRRLYRDPMTGLAEWGLVRAQGRVIGVHSLSSQLPLRTSFGPREAAFAGATGYDQWVFGVDAGAPAQPGPCAHRPDSPCLPP